VLVRYGWGSVGIGAGMTAAFPYFRSALLPRSIAGGSKARTRLCKHARRTQGKWKKVLWQKTTIRRVLLFEHDSCRTIADGLLAGGTVGILPRIVVIRRTLALPLPHPHAFPDLLLANKTTKAVQRSNRCTSVGSSIMRPKMCLIFSPAT